MNRRRFGGSTDRSVEIDRSSFVPGRRGFDLVVVALIFVAYTLTVWVALDLSFGSAVLDGAANTVPVIVFGALARRIMIRRLAGKDVLIQIAGHVVLCLAFCLLSMWLLFILLGLATGISPIEFTVQPFPLKGVAWQSLENLTIYGVIAALSYLQLHVSPARAAVAPYVPRSDSLEGREAHETEQPHYFIRSGEDIRPIDLEKVVSIAGADDYAEVTLLDGKHLVRMTLAEFERTLDAARFLRVHRSWIVNLGYVDRAEPAGGGRMLLHMQSGAPIATSRTGARLLRERII